MVDEIDEIDEIDEMRRQRGAELAQLLDRPDPPYERDPEAAGGNPYEYVAARADEIIAFASAMRNAAPEDWNPQDLATLERMHEVLSEKMRRRVMAVAAAEHWLKARASADPQELLAALAAVDKAFAHLVLTGAEIDMLRDASQHGFEAQRVVAALAVRCKALGLTPCSDPLSQAYAVRLDAAADALKKTRSRYREK
jgi:hypothetical protein